MGNGLKAQSSKLKTKDWREENVRRRAQGVIVGARFIASENADGLNIEYRIKNSEC